MKFNAQVTPQKVLHWDRMARLVSRAMSCGARRESQSRFVWDLSGDCQSPIHTERVGRPEGREKWFAALDRMKRFPIVTASEDGVDLLGQPKVRRRPTRTVAMGRSRKHTLILEAAMRCRSCESCLRLRQRAWAARAAAETEVWPRTWFGTITLSPEHHFLFAARARARLRAAGTDFDTLPAEQQFLERHKQVSPELAKYLKRIRKNTGAPIRFMLVCEKHEGKRGGGANLGMPHYHALIHECDAALPVKHAVLTSGWSFGFTKWKLVSETSQATYLAKYLGKSRVARVRASRSYGAPQATLVKADAKLENVVRVTPCEREEQGAPKKAVPISDTPLTEMNESERVAFVTDFLRQKL